MKKIMTSMLVIVMLFTFTMSAVGAFMPPGLAKKDGLPPGLEKKDELPPGIQKRFINHEQNLQLNNEYETVIEEIDGRTIVIKEGTAFIHLLVATNAYIELDGERVRLNSLQKNDKVYLKLDKNHTVIEIKVISSDQRIDKEIDVYEGTITDINERRNRITVSHNKDSKHYILVQTTRIEIDGIKRAMEIDDLDIGMSVKITIENETVTLVEASKISFVAIVLNINATTNRILLLQSDTRVRYDVDEDVYITVNGNRNKTLGDLNKDMYVEVKLKGGDIVEIVAYDDITIHQA